MYLFYHIIYTLHLGCLSPSLSSTWGSWLTHFIKALFAKGVDWVPLPDAEAVFVQLYRWERGGGRGESAYEMLALSFSLFLNVPLGHICHRKYVGANKRLRQRTGGQAKDLGNELAGAHTARTAKQN